MVKEDGQWGDRRKRQPMGKQMVLYRVIEVLCVLHLFHKCITLAAFIILYVCGLGQSYYELFGFI